MQSILNDFVMFFILNFQGIHDVFFNQLMEDKPKSMEVAVKLDSDGIPLVPPGFVSLRSFTLKRKHDDAGVTYVVYPTNSTANCQFEKNCKIVDRENVSKTLQLRPWINYRHIDISKGDQVSKSIVHVSISNKNTFHHVIHFFQPYFFNHLFDKNSVGYLWV